MNRFVLTALALGLTLRLAFAFGYWVDKPLTQDEREYLLLADSLAHGRGFSYGRGAEGTSQQFSRAPFYPVFLAAVTRTGEILSGTPRIRRGPRGPLQISPAIKLAQAAVGGVTIWLIALWAARAAGEQAGSAAALLAAVYPPLIWLPAYALSEGVFAALALASALLLTMASERAEAGARLAGVPAARTLRRGVEDRTTALQLVLFAGLVAGLAALTRSVILLAVPFVAVSLIRRRQAGLLLLWILAIAIVIGPWTVRNVRHYGRTIVIASDGGVTFWTGNNRLARGEGDLAANPEMKQANLELRARYPGFSAEALEPIYYREALRDIRENPVWWLTLIARKAFYTVVPLGPSYTLHSPLYFWASVLSYVLVLAPAIFGFLELGLRRRRLMGLWCLAAGSLLACLVFFPQERFRLPVIDPALLVCAGVWLALRQRTPPQVETTS